MAILGIVAIALSFLKKSSNVPNIDSIKQKEKDKEIQITKEFKEKQEQLNREKEKELQVIIKNQEIEQKKLSEEYKNDPNKAISMLENEFGIKEFKK